MRVLVKPSTSTPSFQKPSRSGMLSQWS